MLILISLIASKYLVRCVPQFKKIKPPPARKHSKKQLPFYTVKKKKISTDKNNKTNFSESNSHSELSEEEEEEENNQKEQVKNMTNMQEITDFYEYTENCIKLLFEMEASGALDLDKSPIPKERFVNLPFADKIGKGKGKKRLAIFDLDETLIYCELNQENEAQTNLEVVLPNKKTKTIGLNMRPHWKEEMLKTKTKYYIIIYTASHQSYADSVLNTLDPQKEIFDYRLYRNNCTIINFDGKPYYIKDQCMD